MQKSEKKQKKNTKITSNGAHIVHNRLYINRAVLPDHLYLFYILAIKRSTVNEMPVQSWTSKIFTVKWGHLSSVHNTTYNTEQF